MLKSDFTEFDGINLASAKRSKDENIDSKISANKISEKLDLENEDAKVSTVSTTPTTDSLIINTRGDRVLRKP